MLSGEVQDPCVRAHEDHGGDDESYARVGLHTPFSAGRVARTYRRLRKPTAP